MLTNARWMPGEERARIAASWHELRQPGTLLLETCHRVELYGTPAAIGDIYAEAPASVRMLLGRDVADHLVTVAVGRDSSVVAEDQILHQLRRATQSARAGGHLSSELDRLLDLALSAGRRARSWLPARRPSLMDLALARVTGRQDLHGQRMLVVGTGEMGRAAIAHLHSRGATVSVASHTSESSRGAALKFGVAEIAFDPGPAVFTDMAGVVVALKGGWAIERATTDGLLAADAWIVDVSSPPALEHGFAQALGERLLTIDDLAAAGSADVPSQTLLARLDALIAETVGQFGRWAANETRRDAAEALTSRARAVESAELERLWHRVPTLDDAERAEVARALDHLTESLLRDPLEQLGREGDDSHVRAAKELFRL
jgi:glutamyl-tRNA reductase